MKDFWKTIRLGLYVFALPLVATAAASAHQWITDADQIKVPELPATVSIADGAQAATLRQHTIQLDRDGVVHGRVVIIDQESREAIGLGQLKVNFVRDGEIVKQQVTTSDGSFAVEGLAEGAYSFIATGESGFAAYGVNVVSSDEAETVNVMEAAAVSPRFTAVKEILKNRVPREISAEIQALAANEKTNLNVQGANRVQLDAGTLTGNIIPIWGKENVAGTHVHIIQNDKEIATVPVAEDGSFVVKDLAPGVYDFVAAGPKGFAAISFEAVGDGVQISTNMEPAAFAAQTLDVGLTAPADGYYVAQSVDYAYDSYSTGMGTDYAVAPIEYCGEAVGCGSAAGACCGAAGNFGGYGGCCGGGGGFFGGGLGRLLGIAGLTVGIIALADDDDDAGPGPMSPSGT